MAAVREILALVKKDIRLELRARHALGSLVLYVAATMMVLYLSARVLDNGAVWNAIFWVVCVFSAINAAGRTFISQPAGVSAYLLGIASATSIIMAKSIYNAVLLAVLSLLTLGVYGVLFSFPVQDTGLYVLVVVLGNICLSAALTMVAAIASQAGPGGSLMAVLGLPVIVPIIIMAIKVSKNAMDGLDRGVSLNEILSLLLIAIITFVTAALLYPYLAKN